MQREADRTKPGLISHEDAAFNGESPVHLLDAPLTPIDNVFVRNNGLIAGIDADPARWMLRVGGEVDRPLALTPGDLERRFERAEITTVMECAGNGRSLFAPTTDGIPWGLGAVACLRFEGVRLADVLAAAGVRASAVYVGHESPDVTAQGKPALSRGLPLAKALAPETLIATRMNGEPLPLLHGGPLRIVAPGYPGSAWQKWLTRVWVRDREHDGARMTGLDYRLPRRPVAPGDPIDPADFEVITTMPPRSLVTSHAAEAVVPTGTTIALGGWAWGHGEPVATVEVSCDDGVSWADAALGPTPESAFAWRRFSCAVETPLQPGPFVVLARATLVDGRAQPVAQAPWNPKGYCNNACQRLILHAR